MCIIEVGVIELYSLQLQIKSLEAMGSLFFFREAVHVDESLSPREDSKIFDSFMKRFEFYLGSRV